MPKKKAVTKEAAVEPTVETTETQEQTGPYLSDEANQALGDLIEQTEPSDGEPTDTSPEEEVTEEPTETLAEDETEELVTGEPTDTSTEEEDTAEEEHAVKTVPHEAFHAEREKRKEAQAREKEVLDGFRDVSEELKKLKADRLAESEATPIDDYEAEIRKNRKEIAELKEQNVQSRDITQKEAQRLADKELNDAIDKVDSELTGEGLPGFKSLARLVDANIVKKLKSDPGFKDVYDEDPTGTWKRVYKEEVYPEARKVFVKQDKNRLFAEKKKLKAEANLNTNPGRKAEKKTEKTKTEFTYEDYQKELAEASDERKAKALW